MPLEIARPCKIQSSITLVLTLRHCSDLLVIKKTRYVISFKNLRGDSQFTDLTAFCCIIGTNIEQICKSRIKSSEYCMNLDQAIWLHLQVVVESQHILRLCNWIITLHVLRTSRSILRPDQHVLFLLQTILNKLPRWRSQPTRSHPIKKKGRKQSHRNIESVSKNAYLTYLKATAPESKLTTTTTMSLLACYLLVVCCCCQREEKTISENQLPPWY